VKQGIWVLWIGSLAAVLFGSGAVATVGAWVFGLTLVGHLVEFVAMRRLFERAGGSMGHHFVQTLIYGLFHWRPIQERLRSREESPPARS